MRRRVIAAAIASAIAAGITAVAAGGAGPSPGVSSGAPGIAVAGGAHVVATAQAGGTTLVELVRDRDGKTLRSRELPGKLGVPMITFSGVLEGTYAKGSRLVLASSIYEDRTFTTFVTLDTRTLAPLRTIKLKGSFAFDALSPNGRRLYVTQFPNGLNGPIRYLVRSLSLTTGTLDKGTIVDKTEPDERMNGLPMARAWSNDRGWAYTLYHGLESHAFVHALDVKNRRARCLDLPWSGTVQNGLETIQMSWSTSGILTLSQPGAGVLARIDTRKFTVEVVRDPVPPPAS
jgi:hypothetical protein